MNSTTRVVGDMRDVQEAINLRAIELASRASDRVEQHEARCFAQAQEHTVTLKEVGGEVKALHKRIDKLVAGRSFRDTCISDTIIGGLISLICYLLVSGVPWDK